METFFGRFLNLNYAEFTICSHLYTFQKVHVFLFVTEITTASMFLSLIN